MSAPAADRDDDGDGDGTVRVPGVVVAGHGVASGRSGDPRFPGGTIALQRPHFAARGLDLSGFHLGTINVSIAPARWDLVQADHTFRDVRWSPTQPPEDFSFVAIAVEDARGGRHDALVYHPHSDTKPEHVQPDDVVEVLAPWIPGVAVGDHVILVVERASIRLTDQRGGGADPRSPAPRLGTSR